MSTLVEPQIQPQARPGSHQEPQDPQSQAPVVQTRTDFAATTVRMPSMVQTESAAVALDHAHRFPSQVTVTGQHPQQLHFDSHGSSESESERHHHHHHRQLHQLQHHADGGPTSAALAPVQNQSQSQSQSQSQAQLEAANIAHFDALGHDFDKQNPFSAEFADRLSRALRRLSRSGSNGSNGSDHGAGPLVLDEDATSVLDYACGSGQVSRALAPYVAQLVGVDISPRMVEVYNARASTQGLASHEMRAVGSLAELQQQRFDLAVCSMAYHHFPSVEQVTRDLVEYLKPNGVLAVADIAARAPVHAAVDGDEAPAIIPAEYEHIVSHTRGFTDEYMRALFEGAGLVDFTIEQFTSAKWHGRDIDFFLATGTKPVPS